MSQNIETNIVPCNETFGELGKEFDQLWNMRERIVALTCLLVIYVTGSSKTVWLQKSYQNIIIQVDIPNAIVESDRVQQMVCVTLAPYT